MASKKHPFIQYLIWASLPNKWVFWCYLVLSQNWNYDKMSDIPCPVTEWWKF